MKALFLGDLVYDYNTIENDIFEIAEFINSMQVDFTVLNLEASINYGTGKKANINLFQNEKSLIKVLKLLKVKAVNLANNHIFDHGIDGGCEATGSFKKQ